MLGWAGGFVVTTNFLSLEIVADLARAALSLSALLVSVASSSGHLI